MTQLAGNRLRAEFLCVAFLVGLAEMGCGGDDKPAAQNQGVGGGGSTGGTQAATSTTGTSTTSSGGNLSASGGASSTVSSSTPKAQTNLSSSATVSIQSTAAGSGLNLISLNLVPDTTSSLNYVEWFGEVKNTGSSLICFPTATFTFTSSNNTVLWTGTSYADAPPYLNGNSTLTMPCLAPGETGGFWDNELPSSPLTVSGVAGLTIALAGSSYTATPFPHELTVSAVSDTIYRDGNHFSMSGTFKPQQTVYNVGIAGYMKPPGGLIAGQLTATNLDTVAANTSWAFTSLTSVTGSQPSVIAFADFILGAAPEPGVEGSLAAGDEWVNQHAQRRAHNEARLNRARLRAAH